MTKAKVNADVAGLGIAQNVDGSLEVGVDGTTIEITGDVINLVDGSVTTAKLAADAVTNAQLSDNAVQTENILDGTIITADLGATSVTKTKINADVAGLGLDKNLDGSLEVEVDGVTIEITGDAINLKDASVTTAKLAADAVTNAKLADNAVQTENVLDGTLLTADIAGLQITTGLLAADAVTNTKLADNAVQSENILDGTILTADLAATSVTKAKVNADVAGLGIAQNANGSLEVGVDGTTIEITGDVINLVDGSVTTAKLAADAVTNAQLSDNAVQTENVLDGTLLTADIAALQITTGLIAADAIDNSKLADNAVTSSEILDGTISDADIAPNAVTSGKINALAVNTSKIANNAVTGSKIAMGSDVAGDLMYYDGANYTRLAKGTADQVLTMNDGATAPNWEDAQVSYLTKTLSLEAPIAGDNITIFRTYAAITVQEVIATSIGTGSPTTTFVLRHHTDRGNAGTLVTTSTATTSLAAGDIISLSDPTIPAGSWIWFEATAASGTGVILSVDIRYTED